jgi:hypothetical protein
MSVSSDGFYLTPEQLARLTNLAQETGKPLPVVLNDALAAYRPDESVNRPVRGESFYDVASRLGLIGCVKGTPPDLSTNKKHMEGFGQSDS